MNYKATGVEVAAVVKVDATDLTPATQNVRWLAKDERVTPQSWPANARTDRHGLPHMSPITRIEGPQRMATRLPVLPPPPRPTLAGSR